MGRVLTWQVRTRVKRGNNSSFSVEEERSLGGEELVDFRGPTRFWGEAWVPAFHLVQMRESAAS